jgi:CCR4-NOT transcription complex subunit 3
MEKFKACEKEMKTKAFSKEGLIAAMKLDPKAQEKMETSSLVSEWVEELGRQIEQTEAEIETLQAGGKKKKGNAASERLDQLDHLNERRRWHINRLEIILRLVDNGSLPPEKVNQLKDDIKYFVETNTVCAISGGSACMFKPGPRRRTLTKTRASTMSSTLTRRRKRLVS